MKQLLTFVILFFYSILLTGQNFASEGNTWKMKTTYLVGSPSYTFYKVIGESVINGQTYKKMYYSTDNQVTWNLADFVIRQENDIIYKLSDTPGATEVIIYKFNLGIGDSYIPNPCGTQAGVTDVEEVTLYNGEFRNKYRFSTDYLSTFWIDHIGSLDAPIFSPGRADCPPDPVYNLECFFEDGILKYTSNPDNDCSFISSNENIPTLESQLSISPNPSSEYIRIEMDDLTLLDGIHIYSSIGELIHQYEKLESSEISITHLEKGIYFFKFIIGKQIITKRVLKI